MKQELDKESREALINYRMQRAKATLYETEKIIGLGFLNSSVNRMYYTCYYAVIALLVKEKLTRKPTRE